MSSEQVFIGDDSNTEQSPEKPEKLVAMLNGERVEVEAKADQSILDTLIEAGYNPPYSCMDGACMACMAKVVEGRVTQDDPGILTDDNIDARETLTCQAKIVSKSVTIDYDDL